MQAQLRLADGDSKQVIVTGQPLVLNDEACMLFSFVDIELRDKAEIALRLKLAPNIVRIHVLAPYSKLNVHSRSEAVIWARERGLFSKEWRPKERR